MPSTKFDAIIHYKKKLEKSLSDKDIIITLQKIQRIPVTIQILKDSGVGKTVKTYRKHGGDVGTEANKLIQKWKELINLPSDDKPKQAENIKKEESSSSRISSNKHKEKPNDSEHKSSSQKKKNANNLIDYAKSSGNELNNSVASFEDCLNINVNTTVKPKKKKHSSHSSKTHVANDEPSTSNYSINQQSPEKKRKANEEVAMPTELKKPHLEPLDKVDILSTLPDIQPSYKPLPKKDNNVAPRKSATGGDTAQFYTSSKKERTMMYHGRKGMGNQKLYSLQELCVNYVIANISDLSETGGVPFIVLKPVLEKCTPTQLYNLESFNSYLLVDTDYLWKTHCKKDYKGEVLNPENCETWRELYLKCFEDHQNRLDSSIKSFKKSIVAAEKKTSKTIFVDCKVPREIKRKQARYGTSSSSSNSKPHSSSTSSGKSKFSNNSSSLEVSKPYTSAIKKNKPAPLMQKTLKLMKQFRR